MLHSLDRASGKRFRAAHRPRGGSEIPKTGFRNGSGLFQPAPLRWLPRTHSSISVRSFRNVVARVHRWVGLTVGLAIVYLAITGLTMLFRPQIEPLVEARLREVTSCSVREPLDKLIASARAAHPDGAVRQVEIAQGGIGVTVVRYADDVVVLPRYQGSQLIGFIEMKLETWLGLEINRTKREWCNATERRRGESGLSDLHFPLLRRSEKDVRGGT